MKRRTGLTALLLLFAVGCLPEQEGATLVPCSPFIDHAFTPAEARPVDEVPATKETADRVSAVAGKVVSANPGIGFRPRFLTSNSPHEEIYHRGMRDVFVTEGLVRRCETEDQLAAVVCLELAKMVVEREASSDPQTRRPADVEPIDMPVGNDSGGPFGSPDGTRRMELNKYVEQPRHKEDTAPPVPEALAREYLRNAGFKPTASDEPAAPRNTTDRKEVLEKVFKFAW
jgi:hypothetical protein